MQLSLGGPHQSLSGRETIVTPEVSQKRLEDLTRENMKLKLKLNQLQNKGPNEVDLTVVSSFGFIYLLVLFVYLLIYLLRNAFLTFNKIKTPYKTRYLNSYTELFHAQFKNCLINTFVCLYSSFVGANRSPIPIHSCNDIFKSGNISIHMKPFAWLLRPILVSYPRKTSGDLLFSSKFFVISLEDFCFVTLRKTSGHLKLNPSWVNAFLQVQYGNCMLRVTASYYLKSENRMLASPVILDTLCSWNRVVIWGVRTFATHFYYLLVVVMLLDLLWGEGGSRRKVGTGSVINVRKRLDSSFWSTFSYCS